MPTITYVQPDGTRREVEAPVGSTVMLAAVRNNVRGIDAECGGALACATCHVYVDPAWMDRIPPAGEDEADMLEGVAGERRETSRLSCQINVDAALDGLVVEIPAEQG
ncbi:2Fe-2S iron-sulfur cluster-binding protein [Roseomonas sp. NAR14]|uniref:2Fe-2S iron-sulfur cluster-binding protein n=1 Tax=Roseomonas acroporae TaxID=2937791 RepID=A0A9X1Y6U8_9PROT|nr:2Fe-2S iron-sulfur cluster-binding protein [Roseomonas acroporae]MCK8783152.1 2Fe-2S iron-sulfur cluster-binding protein [Roseomonas acroporae]